MNMFFKGVMLGLSVAAPAGPIALLVIRRTLAIGRLSGFVSGLGAALAESSYSLVAALGLTAISNFLVAHQSALQFIGGLLLFFLGAKTFLAKPNEKNPTVVQVDSVKDFVSTFFLTLTNPLTIVLFTAFFAGMGFVSVGSGPSGILLALGVFVGSTSWWFFLTTMLGFFRNLFKPKSLIVINKLSGTMISGFGCWALWRALRVFW